MGKADGLNMKLDLRLPYEEAVLETVTNVDFPLFKSKKMFILGTNHEAFYLIYIGAMGAMSKY